MGDTKALLVGVCEYTFNPSVCPLPFCSNDVAAVYQALIDGLNVSAGNILVSGNNGRITKDCLLSDLQSILNATTDKDTLIIYFSGHGGNNCLAIYQHCQVHLGNYRSHKKQKKIIKKD